MRKAKGRKSKKTGKTSSVLYWAVVCLSELVLVLLSLKLHARSWGSPERQIKEGRDTMTAESLSLLGKIHRRE